MLNNLFGVSKAFMFLLCTTIKLILEFLLFSKAEKILPKIA
jgi:hypothetical protein